MLKNVHIWGPSLFLRWARAGCERTSTSGVKHIIFCLADHFEPMWNRADPDLQLERVERCVKGYPKLASVHRDSNGRPPSHTWFYAAEQYNSEHVERLSKLCEQGFGEIEMHLHHESDTPEGFEEKLETAKAEFSRHGAFITKESPAKFAFGFIHGDFALNNSRERGRWCGVDNELRILRRAGCYADFTLPAAPQAAQTRKINSIYYAKDIPGKRKSHTKGVDVRVGGGSSGDLMLIQGPLALRWVKRKWGFFPGIESGCILGNNAGAPDRIDLWVGQNIHVKGRPEWTFVKVHCHGAQEDDEDALLGEKASEMFGYLEKKYSPERGYRLHYVTAREMYNMVKAAEAGREGDPWTYRNYLIKRYRNTPAQ